jgi:hypothetical protein
VHYGSRDNAWLAHKVINMPNTYLCLTKCAWILSKRSRNSSTFSSAIVPLPSNVAVAGLSRMNLKKRMYDRFYRPIAMTVLMMLTMQLLMVAVPLSLAHPSVWRRSCREILCAAKRDASAHYFKIFGSGCITDVGGSSPVRNTVILYCGECMQVLQEDSRMLTVTYNTCPRTFFLL